MKVGRRVRHFGGRVSKFGQTQAVYLVCALLCCQVLAGCWRFADRRAGITAGAAKRLEGGGAGDYEHTAREGAWVKIENIVPSPSSNLLQKKKFKCLLSDLIDQF
ncbi:hypothetical protein VULLAG_LOCUS5426 [Vulpes lagopus]